MDVQELSKAPLLHFSALCDLPETKKIEKKSDFFLKFAPCSSWGYCRREYLTLLSPFAIFEPWIWRRLGPFPACFFKTNEMTDRISFMS